MHEAATRGQEGSSDPLIGTVLDGRYRIEEPLGAGGIGRVYKARHPTLGRLVALKLLLTQYESIPVLQQRFQREAEVLASLSHPNIVTVTDFGVADGNPYIVMELLEGEDLAALVERSEPLAPKRAFDITRQVLRALAYAHERGLVHRDLKPHNVFVRSLGDGTDHVEVLDFGLARFIGDAAKNAPKLTRAGALIGTPAYMAPEQASGQEVDARADVYAVGCVLFEALTGRRVFESPDPGKVLRAHLLEAPPRLAQIDPGLATSDGLEAFVAKALEKSPSQRFESAQQMLAELDALGPDAAQRVGPRPPRDQPVSPVAPTQGAPGAPARPQATRAATPGAVRAQRTEGASVGASVALPQSRMPILAGVGCLAGVLVAGVGLAVWLSSDETPEAAADDTPPAVVSPQPVDGDEDPAPAQQAAEAPRPPFEGDVPDVLARLHRLTHEGSQMEYADMMELNRYQNANPEDMRPHLLLARHWMNQRNLDRAVPEFRHGLSDRDMRHDPDTLEGMLALVRSNGFHRAATDLVVEVWGAEALGAVNAELEKAGNRNERRRLEALRDRIGEPRDPPAE